MKKTEKTPFSVRRLTGCALFAAVLCVCSVLAVPIGAIPVTLGLFAVLLAPVVLGPVDGAIAVLVYLLLGVCGIPVFSGGNAGFAALLGPTGGYIWSYPFTALLTGLAANGVWKRWGARRSAFLLLLPGCVAGVLMCYACGTAHYAAIAEISFVKALSVCVLPFLPFDFAKCLLASFFGLRIRAQLVRRGGRM